MRLAMTRGVCNRLDHFGSVQSKFSSGLNDCGFPRNCEASMVGIIDPFDTLLASLLGSTSSGTAESAKTSHPTNFFSYLACDLKTQGRKNELNQRHRDQNICAFSSLMGAMVYPNPGGTGAAFATCELTQINPTAAADVRTLKSLARKKTRAGKIAKTLKRTEGATRQKAFSLGVSLDARV